MKKIAMLWLFLLSNHVYATDIKWFENEWISDRDATILANPQYMTVDEKTQITFRSFFGKMRWVVKDGAITSLRDGGNSFSLEYSLIPIDKNKFELHMASDSGTWTILKSEIGFCGGVITSWKGAKSILESMDSVPGLTDAVAKMSTDSRNLWEQVVPNFVECFAKKDS